MDNARRKVTASFGVATLEPGKLSDNHQAVIDQLITGADKAMYLSKKNGRNRVTHLVDLLTYSQKKS